MSITAFIAALLLSSSWDISRPEHDRYHLARRDQLELALGAG